MRGQYLGKQVATDRKETFHVKSTRALIGALAMAALVFTACGDNKKDTDNTAASATSTTAAAPTAVSVTAKEYAFTVPSMPTGVVKITLTNEGKEPHDFQLIAVDGTHTKDEIVKVVGSDDAPIPSWLHGAGGVGSVAPGASPGTAYVKLEAGKTYWYFCSENTDDNKPHSALGMIGQLTVSGTSASDALPSAPASVTAKEYTFDIQGLKSGEQLVKFANDGPMQIHHFVAFPMLPGKTIDDVKKAFSSNDQSGPPPVDFEKGVQVSALDPGQSEVAQVNFAPGDYAFVCFLTDHAGGPPHLAKGMIKEFKVS